MPKRTWEIVKEVAQLHGMDGGRASELSRHRGTYEIRYRDACVRFDRRGYGNTHLTLKGFTVPHAKPFGVLATLEEAAERVCDLIENQSKLARAVIDSEEATLRALERKTAKQALKYEAVLDALGAVAAGERS